MFKHNTITARVTFPQLVDLIDKRFPNLISLNIFGLLIDFEELTKLSHTSMWTNLQHFELGFCGLWLNLEKLKAVLGRAIKLEHFVFEKSAGVSFNEHDASELWSQVTGRSTKKQSPIKLRPKPH